MMNPPISNGDFMDPDDILPGLGSIAMQMMHKQAALLDHICMEGLRKILPDPNHLDLFYSDRARVPGLDITTMPLGHNRQKVVTKFMEQPIVEAELYCGIEVVEGATTCRVELLSLKFCV